MELEQIRASVNNTLISDWLSTASVSDISQVIELGFPIFCKINESVAKQLSEIKQIQPVIDRSPLPVFRGQIGEDFVENILKKHFGAGVSNVAKNPKSGDLTLFLNHRKICVEVKNYTNSVPSSGVEKFRRDLNTTNACGGLFISLNTSITGITSSFTIVYEPSDTKTIPVAYIVSKDESAIIVAINIVSQLIAAVDYVYAESYSRDKIMNSIYELAESLDNVSRVRNDLQVSINDITDGLIKSSLGLVKAENDIRKSIDSVRGELYFKQQIDVEPAIVELETNPNFAKKPSEIKQCVAGVMKCVQETLHKKDIIGSIWKLSARKCMNTVSGISFNLLANKIEVNIPRTKVSIETIVKSMNAFGKKISITDTVCVELDNSTYDWVCEIIRGAC